MVDLSRYEEMGEALDEIAAEIPERLFQGLNGGVIFSEETKYHPESENGDLLIMGQYIQSVVGKTIVLYYGSFMERFGFLPIEEVKKELRKTFFHEMTHHLETLAGENDLVLEDIEFMEKYREGKKR